MSAKLYDEALVEKLKKWTDKTMVQVVNADETERLLMTLADRNNDNPIQVPLISLRRDGGYDVDLKGKRYFTSNGAIIESSDKKSVVINAIPITIPYKLDVYTRYRSEAEEFAQNLVFNIINYPKLTVRVEYKDVSFEHDANIRIISGVADTSDAPPRIAGGQFTRYTIDLNIDDAYLWDLRAKNNYYIADINVESEDEK